MDCPEGELSILLVDDREMAALNREYLQREGTTNVIAFPMQEGEFSDITPYLLGDVVICVDTAQREAKEGGIAFGERFDQLLVHGILHLFGYDHVSEGEQARRMEEKSEELLEHVRRMPSARSPADAD